MQKILLTIISLILFQKIQTTEFNCAVTTFTSLEPLLTKEKKVKLCVHFLPFAVKVAFEIQVDNALTLTVRRGYEALKSFDNDFVVQFENSEKFSNLIPHYRKRDEKNIVFPVVSLVVNVDKGKISTIENEDLSHACLDTKEIPDFIKDSNYPFVDTEGRVNACPLECKSGENESGKCDLKIFISWKGTDKNGKSLVSASQKFTNFKNYNLRGLFDSILETNVDADDEVIPYNPADIDSDVSQRLVNGGPIEDKMEEEGNKI